MIEKKSVMMCAVTEREIVHAVTDLLLRKEEGQWASCYGYGMCERTCVPTTKGQHNL